MLGVPLGDYVLLVRRLGYEGTTVKISVESEAATRVAFALNPAGVRLAEIEVKDRGVSQRMTEFYERRALGVGHFSAREEIVTRNPVSTFEMFRGIPSLRIGDMGTDGTAKIVSTRSRCAPQIMLNGLPITAAYVPAPTEVGGIEVYAGPATIPLQFKGKGAWCALILIWTGDGR